MTPEEAAKKWRISVGTVRKYCREGYVSGLLQDGRRRYAIPDGAKPPYVPRKTAGRRAFVHDIADFLKAYNTRMAIHGPCFGLSGEEVAEVLKLMAEQGLLKLKSKSLNAELPESYGITYAGIEIAQRQRAERIKLLVEVFKTLKP